MNDGQVEPIILSKPVAAVVPPVKGHRFDRVIKVFSWMTATFLAAAVVLALITGSMERKHLQEAVSRQSSELVCRTLAAAVVTEANTERDNTIAETVVAVANGDSAEIHRLLAVLTVQTDKVNEAILEQEKALTACAKQ